MKKFTKPKPILNTTQLALYKSLSVSYKIKF